MWLKIKLYLKNIKISQYFVKIIHLQEELLSNKKESRDKFKLVPFT